MKKRKFRKVIILLLLVYFSVGIIQNSHSIISSFFENIKVNHLRLSSNSEEWNLIVVNRWNELPKDFSISLTELSNGQRVDSRIYSYLQEMFDAARKDGIYPVVREGYRTEKEQKDILNDKVQAYINKGYSKRKAQQMAKDWVAIPGTSEHQLGIAIDINAHKTYSTNDEVYSWLAENAYKYGFILRYPQGKEEITGIEYEPWHYRYVGKEEAKEIFNNHLCLEEYNALF